MQNYNDMIIYEVAKVKDIGQKYFVEYVTISTIPWVASNLNEATIFLPLNPLASEKIRDAHRLGQDVYIEKEWNKYSNEVILPSLEINPVMDLETYKRRANGFIKAFINPIMASVHASVVYGFTTLNNKFIEMGFVFSEENRTLKYIEILDKTDELEETNPELSAALQNDLEKYIEYREILDRSNFVWNESEKYIEKISKQTEKEMVDDLVLEFQHKINTLNNLK